MIVHQMLIVIIILDHTIANATTVILAMAQSVIKVGTCLFVQSLAVVENRTVVFSLNCTSQLKTVSFKF